MMTRLHTSPAPAAVASDSTSRDSTWVVWRGMRQTANQVVRTWKTFPARAWRRWVFVLVLGFVPAAGVCAALTLWARSCVDAGLQVWDERGLRWVEAHGPISFQNAILLESFGNLTYLIPLTACVALFTIWRGRLFIALTIIASYVLTRFVVLVGWTLWDRARPTLIAGGLAAPPLHSYPSGHMALLVSVYGLLAYLWMRASGSWGERMLAFILLLMLIAVVGLARIRLGSHWPSDVIAGTIVGFVWVAAVIAALRAAERAGGR